MLMLQTPRLVLSILDPEYASITADYMQRNYLFFEEWGPTIDRRLLTNDGQQAHLAREQEHAKAQAGFRFWLQRREGHSAQQYILGEIALSQIIRGGFQSCYLGYRLDREAVGEGYMLEAIDRVIKFAFNELHLHRIEANIMPHNSRSRRLIAQLGFVEEGLARKYIKIQGAWRDHIHYVRFNPHEE